MATRGQLHLAYVDEAIGKLTKIQEFINAGMEGAIDITEDLVAATDSEESKEKLGEIEEAMFQYSRMDRDRKQFLEAVEYVKEQAANLGPTETADLGEYLEVKLAEIQTRNTDSDLKQHEKFLEFQAKVNQENDSVGTLMTQNLPDDTEEDAEIVVTQQEVNTKCPYTGLEMQHPVRNKRCGHNYDRDGIKQFIKDRGARAKCPVGGCANSQQVQMKDLEDNKELKKYIEQRNRSSGKRTSKKRA